MSVPPYGVDLIAIVPLTRFTRSRILIMPNPEEYWAVLV